VFKVACKTDDVWEGEFLEFTVDGRDVIVVHTEGGGFRAYDAQCPHQDQSLGEASLEGNVLTCPAHLWQFDVVTGEGVNPKNCKLTSYACKVEAESVFIDIESEHFFEESASNTTGENDE
jgi:toluene monooxygenase system ferredoxin subunit